MYQCNKGEMLKTFMIPQTSHITFEENSIGELYMLENPSNHSTMVTFVMYFLY